MQLVIDISETLKGIADDEDGKTFSHIMWQAILMDSIKNGTPLDSIIADIEAARDKDKLCEYPYNRCINIIKKAVGDES